jgi:hypothetical protein
MTTNNLLFQVEPQELIDAVQQNPPLDFEAYPISIAEQVLPAFLAEFDLLLTADQPLQRLVHNVSRLLPTKLCNALLRPRTLFIGTTVSEFALFPQQLDYKTLPGVLLGHMAKQKAKFLIIKDIAPETPFLSTSENAASPQICTAFTDAGFVLLEGQALAYIPIDFTSLDEFFSRFSASRRSDFRRKRKKRTAMQLQLIPTGDVLFRDPSIVDEFYQLYENVYNNSEIHFEKLTRAFFEKVLNDGDSKGLIFAYSRNGERIGYSLCFQRGDFLIDKYHGAKYPDFRDNNLYYVNWFDMLEYAVEHSCKIAIFGWTNPEIKAYLGSSFVFTKHAVYTTNPVFRQLLRHFGPSFESDRNTLDSWCALHNKKKD